MNNLLTIAIPTFNRAELLDKQLAWLAQVITGFESECEIIISDNCSTDNTQEVVKKWQSVFRTTFKSNKNSENIGLVRNIAYCLSAAKNKYVWTIGDDDPIDNTALAYVISSIKQYPDLSLLFLNYSGRNQKTGQAVYPPTIVGNRWFDIASEEASSNGKALFEHCLEKSTGSVMFITAAVYRTELVQQALEKWPSSSSNWIAQVYWTGFCAAHGSVIVTKKLYIECIVGVSYWQREPKHALMMQYKHIPEVLLKLQAAGYSKKFCRRMIVKKFTENNLKVFLGALKRWPLLTGKTVIPVLGLVFISLFELIPQKNLGTRINDGIPLTN